MTSISDSGFSTGAFPAAICCDSISPPPRYVTLVGIELEPQEVGGARDARVVVAYRLLALARELLFGQVYPLGHEATQVVLDRPLVLRGGRHYFGLEDSSIVVQRVAVVEDAPGSLRY